MALPDGSMVLICPVGPDYSQVGDDTFDSWNDDPNIHVEEITDASIFATWFSNVKRVTTLFTIESTEETELPEPVASTGIQWSLGVSSYLPEEPNNGGHPFPRMVFDGGRFEVPGPLPVYFTYLNEDYPDAPYYTGLPLFFIHRDKFYFKADLPYLYLDGTQEHTVTLTADDFTQVTVDTLLSGEVITRTYAITINQLFYP
jgi:hypothetical protein